MIFKKRITIRLAIGIVICSNALILETFAILHFGNVYNIYTVAPLLMTFISILIISNEYDNSAKVKLANKQ